MSKDLTRDDILFQNIDKRITITGRIDKHTEKEIKGMRLQTTLLQDVYWEADGTQTDLGHLWVQDSWQLWKYHRPQQIRCEVRVKQYKAYNDISRTYDLRCTVAYPEHIELLGPVIGEPEETAEQYIPDDVLDAAPEEVAQPMPAAALDTPEVSPIVLIREVRRVAAMAGGMDELKQLLEALG